MVPLAPRHRTPRPGSAAGLLVVVAALVLSVVGLAGCGSGDDGGVQIGDTVPLADLSARELAAMKAAGSAKVTSTTPTSTMSGSMSYTAAGQSLSLSGTSLGQPVDVVYVGGILYLGGMEESTAGKHFIKIDPAGTDSLSRQLGPLLTTFDQLQNPVSVYATIPGVTARVVSVDHGTVGYAASISATQLKSMAGPEASASPGEVGVTLRQSVDPQGRIVHTDVVIGDTTLTYTYSDWGTPVSISAPAPSDVAPYTGS